jgi:hypothetical protein
MAQKNQPDKGKEKGAKRQSIHAHQDNKGDKKNPPQFEDFNGNPIK